MLAALPLVSTTLSASIITTWSPVSMCGANVGLCLPWSTVGGLRAQAAEHQAVSSVDHVPGTVISLAFGL